MAIPFNEGLDITIQKWVGISKLVLPEKTKPAPDQVIFIDVSKSRYLVPVNSDSTENDVIVNRQYLTRLFRFISANQNNVKYIFTDVIFDMPTADDSALSASMHALGNKFLCINTYNGDSAFQKNMLNARAATASVILQSGTVYKIPMLGSFADTLVPFKMYYDLEGHHIKSNFLFTWFSKQGLAFNTQINDYVLRGKDFTGGGYTKIGLGELVSLLQLSPEIFSQYLQGRYILIGDFENDSHSTYLNDQPGTLILFNAYLHLKNGQQFLSIWYLIILYLFLYTVVWMHANKKTVVYKLTLKVKFFQPFLIPMNIISVSILLIAFTYLSSLLFGTNISVFHLIAIFSLVEMGQFFISKIVKKPAGVPPKP
jgi:hypothetical protein